MTDSFVSVSIGKKYSLKSEVLLVICGLVSKIHHVIIHRIKSNLYLLLSRFTLWYVSEKGIIRIRNEPKNRNVSK